MATQEAVTAGAGYALVIVGFVSLALAIVNLFPFLPLDGGHVLWVACREGPRAARLARRDVALQLGRDRAAGGFLVINGLSNDITRLGGSNPPQARRPGHEHVAGALRRHRAHARLAGALLIGIRHEPLGCLRIWPARTRRRRAWRAARSMAAAGRAVDARRSPRRCGARRQPSRPRRGPDPDDSVSLTWSQLRRASTRRRGPGQLGVQRGQTRRDHARQPSRVPRRRPGGGDTRRDAVLDLHDLSRRGDRVSGHRRRAPGWRSSSRRTCRVMLEARENLPDLEHVIVDRRRRPRRDLALGRGRGVGSRPRRRGGRRAVQPEDVLTLIYTSGTTGPPKGVQLSHRNVMFAAQAIEEIIASRAGGRVISWLPAAHIAERMAHHYLPIDLRRHGHHAAPNPREILSYLPQVHPHWFFAVPRIWEKLKAGLETMLAGQPEEQRAPIEGAIARGDRAGPAASSAASRFPRSLRPQVAKADEEMFSQAARDARPRPGRSPSTSAPPRRRSRCSSSSTRSGSSWPSCGGCRRPAGPARQPRRRGQDRHRRAAGPRRRDHDRRGWRGAGAAASS